MVAFEVNTPKTASIAAGLTERLKVGDNVPDSSGMLGNTKILRFMHV